MSRRPRLPARLLARAAIALLPLVAACGALGDMLSPGRPEAYQQVPARIALAAQVPSFARGQLATPQLRVASFYERADSSRVPLATVVLPLNDVATQTLPLAIDLSTCLLDAQRRGTELGTGRSSVCLVSLELTLLDGERSVDQQIVGPLPLLPGATATVPDPVALFEVAGVQVTPPAGAPAGAAARIERGATASISATVTSTSGQVVTGRAVRWSSSAPAIARVDAVTGVVTALAVGQARITASTGTRSGGIDVNVVPPPSLITVAPIPATTGSGTVRSLPAGIDCRVTNGQATGACSATFLGDAQVTLTAIPDTGSVVGAWAGACLGIAVGPNCVLSADQPRTATIGFAPMRRLAVGSAVAAGNDGAGSVRSAPVGIDCQISGANAAGTCTAPFAEGQVVTLTAVPAPDNVFLGWTGDCAATLGPVCTLTVAGGDRSVAANFGAPVRLSVGVTGAGAGDVSVVVNGVTTLVCGFGATQSGSCVATLPVGTLVTLVATPQPGSTFAGWTGACSGTGVCRVTVDQARSVGAVFTKRQVTLTLALGGAGGGAVQSNGQTACTLATGQGAATCRLLVDAGTTVALTVVPNTGSSFGGWSTACATAAGTSCSLTPQADATVGLVFLATPASIVVQPVAGATGLGTVTSTPARISCTLSGTAGSGICGAGFTVGTTVTLTAAPAGNARFTGWGGACAAAVGPTCTLTVAAGANTATARFDLAQGLVVVTGAGTGGGRVTSAPAGIDCRLDAGVAAPSSSCIRSFTGQSAVTLTAAPDPTSTFTGWSGACSGTLPTCVVSPSTGATATATFTRNTTSQSLAVSTVGTGVGTVTSTPDGIDCPGVCSATFITGTIVTLTATPAPGSVFGGWAGACSGTGPCTVSLDVARSVTASFSEVVPSYALTVSTAGTGAGLVTSSPRGIDCPGVCSVSFLSGTVVTLTAVQNAGSVFAGWSGACSGTDACTVTMDAAQRVTATFNSVVASSPLTVVVDGSGLGSVRSTPPGIGCLDTCTASYPIGSTVTLVATPSRGNVFAGWSGACTGTGPCTVTMNGAQRVTATFSAGTVPTFGLTVVATGTGIGSVASTPAGVACPSICTAYFGVGTVVTLVATPTSSGAFLGWSGACVGIGACQVTMDAARSVTATFSATIPGASVVVATTGTGTGVVTSSPAGIVCGTTCSASFTFGSLVQLTATPSAGSVFSGWSGACVGSSPTCTFTATGGQSVTATFTEGAPVANLDVAVGGTGTGRVTSSPGGVDCPGTCTASFAVGTLVTLTATPTGGATFAGWGGACSGTGSCTVTIASAQSVTATFATPVTPTFTLNVIGVGDGVQAGRVTSSPAGIDCPGTCTARYLSGTIVTLTPTPVPGSVFLRWEGACTGSGGCQILIDRAREVRAWFGLPPLMRGTRAPAAVPAVPARPNASRPQSR